MTVRLLMSYLIGQSTNREMWQMRISKSIIHTLKQVLFRYSKKSTKMILEKDSSTIKSTIKILVLIFLISPLSHKSVLMEDQLFTFVLSLCSNRFLRISNLKRMNLHLLHQYLNTTTTNSF